MLSCISVILSLLWVASLTVILLAKEGDVSTYRAAAIASNVGLFLAAAVAGAIMILACGKDGVAWNADKNPCLDGGELSTTTGQSSFEPQSLEETRRAVRQELEKEVNEYMRKELVRRELAMKLRQAHYTTTIESRLAEMQLAYDSLSALFQRRVYSLSDLDEQASARLSLDMRESLLEAPKALYVYPEDEGKPEEVFIRAYGDVNKQINEGKNKNKSSIATGAVQWESACRAARQIRDPNYTLRMFYTDVRHAFPELALYMARRVEHQAGTVDMTSGITPADEYRRTVGALFCVYWLARIDMDGKRGFTYGVDDDWTPLPVPPLSPDVAEDPELQKRRDFYEHQEWEGLSQLLFDAGMLMRCPTSGSCMVNEERMLAMLALTAIHDVMKVEALLPRVEEKHAPYRGYQAGDIINDHDAALGYVLDHHPHCLPSYQGLPELQQKTLRFTQSKMSFNHGWLVQAEAPPEALFSKFKQVADTGGAEPTDIAFYFVHWLTDLAAAVPTPLEGAEKFVLKFPRPVLGSFIRSFSVLNELAVKTETQVFEQYLNDWWTENIARLGPVPEGPHSIAIMRLVVQAQAEEKQRSIIGAFSALGPEDRKVLCEEMAQSGIAGQFFERSSRVGIDSARCSEADDASPSETRPKILEEPLKSKGGPAILVYYSPAFLRTLTPDEALPALGLLAEIYRRARQLWPSKPDLTGSVTVRIDQVKELKLSEIQHAYSFGDTWVLTRRNDLEAVLERIPLDLLAERPKDKTKVLKFWKRAVSRKDQIASAASLAAERTPSTPCSQSHASGLSPSGRSTPTVISRGAGPDRSWL